MPELNWDAWGGRKRDLFLCDDKQHRSENDIFNVVKKQIKLSFTNRLDLIHILHLGKKIVGAGTPHSLTMPHNTNIRVVFKDRKYDHINIISNA